MKSQESCAILFNIRSAENVGAMFRTADAAGISHIHLVGYTPDPLDRFLRPRKDIAKTALGAEKEIPWTHSATLPPLLQKLKQEDFTIIAIEQSENSIDYKKISAQGGPASYWNKIAFLVGNEVEGLPQNILELVDVVAEIPMKGKKESLNVATAFGIAVFRILNI